MNARVPCAKELWSPPSPPASHACLVFRRSDTDWLVDDYPIRVGAPGTRQVVSRRILTAVPWHVLTKVVVVGGEREREREGEIEVGNECKQS